MILKTLALFVLAPFIVLLSLQFVSAQTELALLPGDPGFSGNVEIVDLDTSRDFTCGLTASGDIRCWGNNRFAPILARGFVDVTVGRTFTCGLKADGTVQCLGFDWLNAGQTTPPVSRTRRTNSFFRDRLVGGAPVRHRQGKRTSNLLGTATFTDNLPGTSSGNFRLNYDFSQDEFSYISVGKWNTCGVLAGGADAGQIRCWGYNAFMESNVPAQYASSNFAAVETGDKFTCGLIGEGQDAGKVVCWGFDGHQAVSGVPQEERFTDISANSHHACGVTTDGRALCWGGADNPPEPKRDYGQTSAPNQYRNATFNKIIAAQYHTCATLDGRNDQTAGEVVCWGAEFEHDPLRPELVAGGRTTPFNYRYPSPNIDPKVATGWYYNCVLTEDRDVVCWGGGVTKRTYTQGPFIDLSVGWDHTCAVRAGGHVMCWGRNNNLQSSGWSRATLSPQLQADSSLVENLTTDYTFKAVSLSYYHSCGILDGRTPGQMVGRALCWGHNADGQAAPPPSTFNEISAGLYHGCGLLDGQNGRLENRIECWGCDQRR